MHRSRIGGLIIDCQTDDLDAAADFWGQALGLDRRPLESPEDADYIAFRVGPNDLDIEVQRVNHPNRVHIDIEADNVEAEVERLEALGAKRVAQVREWWVMEAPTGHRFCVVRPQRSELATEGNVWE